MTATAIHPLHYSLYRQRGVGGLTPRNMSKLRGATVAQVEGLTNIALEIFTNCVNAGTPFQDAICAVYLSGLNHGAFAKQENDDERHREQKGQSTPAPDDARHGASAGLHTEGTAGDEDQRIT